MITPRNAAPARLRRARRAAVSNRALSSTRSTMNRMNSGSIICSPVVSKASEERAGGVPVRPEPAQIVAQIRPPLPAIEGLRCPRRLIVESPLGVVLNKRAIALTRRARRLGHFRLEGVPDRARRLGPSCAPAPAGGI